MLQFTESAVAKMREVMQEHNKPYIRFGVKGGGCAGFEYKMDVESEKSDKDQVIEYGDVKILVDPVCEFYLLGTEVEKKSGIFKVVQNQVCIKYYSKTLMIQINKK